MRRPGNNYLQNDSFSLCFSKRQALVHANYLPARYCILLDRWFKVTHNT